MVDHGGVRQPGVGATQRFGHVRVEHGHALDVGLVDHRLVPRDRRASVLAPVEPGIHDDRARHVRGAVGGIGLVAERVVVGVPEHRWVPRQLAVQRLGVGIDEELGRVAARPAARVVGTVDPEAVPLARPDVRQVAVPDEAGDLGQGDAGLAAELVEQAQLDPLGDLREQAEVGTHPVPGGAERVRAARPHLLLSHRPSSTPRDASGTAWSRTGPAADRASWARGGASAPTSGHVRRRGRPSTAAGA